MPLLNPLRVRHRMAEVHLGTAQELADATGIPFDGLRNVIGGRMPARLTRIYRVAEALQRPGETVRQVVADILADGNDGVPDEPPHQPTQPKGPPPRPDRDPRKTGPKRAQSRRAA